MVGTIELVRQLIVPFHQFLDFTNERPAHVFDFSEIFCLAQLRKDDFKDDTEFLVLGDGLKDPLTQGGL